MQIYLRTVIGLCGTLQPALPTRFRVTPPMAPVKPNLSRMLEIIFANIRVLGSFPLDRKPPVWEVLGDMEVCEVTPKFWNIFRNLSHFPPFHPTTKPPRPLTPSDTVMGRKKKSIYPLDKPPPMPYNAPMTTKTRTPVTVPPRTAWEADLAAAYDAAHDAVTCIQVAPMIVQGREGAYYVEGGVCGFARVEVRPRTSAWAKWLKGIGWNSSDYHKCVYLNISDFGQSMQRKEAFAAAFAAVLTAKGYPGVDYTSTID